MNWYVIKTKNGSEKKIKGAIEQKLEQKDLMKYVDQIFLPVQKQVQLRNNKKYLKEVALMSGYLFIKAELNGEVLRTVKNVAGVADLIEEAIQESQMRNLINSESDVALKNEYYIGQWVQITSGAFTNFKGEIQQIHTEKGILTVDILIFGRKTPLDISMADTQKI